MGFEAGVGQLADNLVDDVLPGAAAGQPAAREQVGDVAQAGRHKGHLAGHVQLRHRVDLDPDVGALGAARPGQDAADGLQALEGCGDRMHGHWTFGRFEDQPLGVLRVGPEEAVAAEPEQADGGVIGVDDLAGPVIDEDRAGNVLPAETCGHRAEIIPSRDLRLLSKSH